jgi:hypothetical protein
MGMTMAGCLSTAGLVVVLAGLLGGAGRFGWLAVASHRAVGRLPVVTAPSPLIRAAARTRTPPVRCIATHDRVAFCAGLVRTRVYVGTALLDALRDDELQAVLAHEAEHARRRDPLRRAVHRAVAEVFFCLPLLAWWSRRRIEHSELSADRAAIAQVGAGPLARALCSAAPSPSTLVAAFEGAGPARVAQLLGEEPEQARPSALVCTVSALGLVLLVSLAMCLAQTVAPGLFA